MDHLETIGRYSRNKTFILSSCYQLSFVLTKGILYQRNNNLLIHGGRRQLFIRLTEKQGNVWMGRWQLRASDDGWLTFNGQDGRAPKVLLNLSSILPKGRLKNGLLERSKDELRCRRQIAEWQKEVQSSKPVISMSKSSSGTSS